MAIKPPNWAKGAIPTPQGWRDGRTGELLKSQLITPAQIAEYYGEPASKYEQPVQLNEAPPNNSSIDEWNDVEIEAETNRRESIIGRVTSYLTE